jgi:hypothetical protein
VGSSCNLVFFTLIYLAKMPSPKVLGLDLSKPPAELLIASGISLWYQAMAALDHSAFIFSWVFSRTSVVSSHLPGRVISREEAPRTYSKLARR